MRIRHMCTVAGLLVVLSGTASGQPTAPTLISPSADVTGSTIAFSWQSVPNATWYQLWLGTVDASLVMEQCYTAEHAGWPNGATCSILVTPPSAAPRSRGTSAAGDQADTARGAP
jgi:hypothetical protein